jgi:hypothetical protein
MNRFRSYIARFLVILFVCTGFALHITQPVQAKQSSDAFARWLSTMTKSSDATDLHKELNELKKSGAHLDKVIEKASRIIVRNNEEFNFSFAESAASHHIYELLLIEWNQFQTGNAMAAVPVQQTLKPFLPFNLDKLGIFGSVVLFYATPDISQIEQEHLQASQTITAISVVPMSDCIAIGAP